MVHHKGNTLHFANAKAYHDYLAFIHIHKKTKQHHHPVVIAGKLHHVCHHCGSMYHHHSQHHSVVKNLKHQQHHSNGLLGQNNVDNKTVYPHLYGINGKPIKSYIGPLIGNEQVEEPNRVYSSKSPYGGKNDLIGPIWKKGRKVGEGNSIYNILKKKTKKGQTNLVYGNSLLNIKG